MFGSCSVLSLRPFALSGLDSSFNFDTYSLHAILNRARSNTCGSCSLGNYADLAVALQVRLAHLCGVRLLGLHSQGLREIGLRYAPARIPSRWISPSLISSTRWPFTRLPNQLVW